MRARVIDCGTYEVARSRDGGYALALNGRRWFAWVATSGSELLIGLSAAPTRLSVLRSGRFVLVSYDGDPTGDGAMHLFLQRGPRFREVVLALGLPSEGGRLTPIAITTESFTRDELRRLLRGATGSASVVAWMRGRSPPGP